MKRFAIHKVRNKLLAGVLLTSLAALVITGISLLVYDLRSYNALRVSDWMTQAEIIGRANVAALQFEDRQFAEKNLELLKFRPDMEMAALYSAKGALFASYVRDGISRDRLPALPETDGIRIVDNTLNLYKRIVDNGEILGAIYLRVHYGFYERLWSYLAIVLAVSAFALAVSLLLSSWLQRTLTRPIMDVSAIAKRVVDSRDFSLRATKTTEDEIGSLVDTFNNMLAEIERQTRALEESNQALASQIANRAEAELALRESERRNRTLINASSSIVWTTDKSQRFDEAQPAWQAYTGQGEDESRGTGWRRAFEAEDREKLSSQWNAAQQEKIAFECELKLWHAASNAYRFVSLRAAPVLDEHDEIVEWIGTISDLNERRLAEAEIKRLNADLEERVLKRTEELEATNRELESFSYSVSHDLRAPLRAIDGYSRMVEEDYGDRFDEDGRRMLKVVREEAVRMGRLIDDLLSFSKMSRKTMDTVQNIDMTALAKDVAASLLREQDAARVRFDIWPLPAVHGDIALLRQVWINLLSNALKYSGTKPKSEVLVTGEEVNGDAVFRVQDNGVGFDMKYAAKLFGVFQRLHKAEEFEGTGVGLAIVHRVIVRHGGSIRADARPGEGATFHFTLPKRSIHD
ncbi:MAG TPA: ATP-binding protein [Burkholderiales bacterium]|nr:ATP-binding protein [Burkholderiales bacterium]